MRDLFRESFLGRLLHLATGGRLCQTAEQLDPSLLEVYREGALTRRASSERTLSPADRDGQAVRRSNSEKSAKLGDDGLVTPAATANAEAEKGHDYQLVTWTEGDPENPRNWSTLKKFFVTFQICFLTFSVYIGSAIYTPGLYGVMMDFNVSQTVALLGLTLFILGYALGPMVLAPMSEMPFFGRMPIYIITLIVFVCLQLPIIYAKNIGTVLAFRFLTGVFGSPALATGGASIADMYVPKKQAYGIAVWGLSAVCGPTMGPLIGGFAVQAKDWTWTIWELLWLSGFALVMLVVLLPETSSSNILYRRTVRYRKLTGNDKLKCEAELEAENMTGKEIAMMILVRPFTLSFSEPIVFFLNIYIALIYALLYLWFESFPLVFGGIYGFDLGQNGLAFLGILVGGLLVIGPFCLYVWKYQEPLFDENGNIKPELRLRPTLVGCFFIPLCMFWFGWSSRPSVHWIMPVIGSSFFTIGAFLSFMGVLSYLGDAYPKYVASVYAGNDLVRSSFGAGFPLFANAMFKQLGIDWGNSLLGFFGIAFIPIPFVLYKYGENLRRRSKMARHDL